MINGAWKSVEKNAKARDRAVRLTADVVLSGINVMTMRYSKSLSTREKSRKNERQVRGGLLFFFKDWFFVVFYDIVLKNR